MRCVVWSATGGRTFIHVPMGPSILGWPATKGEWGRTLSSLMGILHEKRTSFFQDRRVWSLESNGLYTVKSLVKHLSTASPLDKHLEKVLRKSKSPWRVNITVCIMLFGSLNCASVLQKKLQSRCLSPNICHLYMSDSKDLRHLFYSCSHAKKCWQRLFHIFNLSWVFGNDFKDNTIQLLIGPTLIKEFRLIEANAIKAMLSELWYERNQRVFHNKALPWLDRVEIAKSMPPSGAVLTVNLKITRFNL